MVPPRGEECMVGENGCPYRHHGALYDGVISTHLFKIFLSKSEGPIHQFNQSEQIFDLLGFFCWRRCGSRNVDTSLTLPWIT